MATRSKLITGFSTVDAITPKTRLYDVELVKRDLLNHFMTRKGERVMRPNFGCIIWNLLFEPYTESVKNMIIADVQNIVSQDPRVDLLNLNVTEDDHYISLEMYLHYIHYDSADFLYVNYARNNFISNVGLDS